MDLLQRLGGRKFLMAVAAIGFAGFLEVGTLKGLTPTMAAFLIAMVGAFSAANYATTANYVNNKTPNGDDGGLDEMHGKVDTILSLAKSSTDTTAVNELGQILRQILDNVSQVQATSGQIGQAMLNVSKTVGEVKRAVSQPPF